MRASTDHASTDDRLRRSIVREYREMPGHRLTATQAGHLWGVGVDRVSAVLDELVAAHLLTRTSDGLYRWAGGGDRSAQPPVRRRRSPR